MAVPFCENCEKPPLVGKPAIFHSLIFLLCTDIGVSPYFSSLIQFCAALRGARLSEPFDFPGALHGLLEGDDRLRGL